MRFYSTRGQLEEFFKSSVIWKDIETELDIWLDEVHRQLENNDGEFSSRILDRLGGSAEAIRNFKDLQKVIMTNYDIDQTGGNNDV